jgi:signal transduction histidine kinase
VPLDPVAGAIAFFAFGANALGTILLLLLNPASRGLRWYATFNVVLLLWLALQGAAVLGYASATTWWVYAAAVHMLPAFFVAATLADLHDRPARELLAILLLGAVVFLLMDDPLNSPLTVVWQAAGWGTGALLRGRERRHRTAGSASGRSVRRLLFVLVMIIPLAVIGAFVLRLGFVLYALPLITVTVQVLVFTGIFRHRFYDVEVRAARTGELAAAAAEQERLAVMGELAASVAHEVRNPLTGMRSLTQMLGEPRVSDESRRRYTEVILGEIDRIERMVDNLLDLSRRAAPTGNGTGGTLLTPLFEDLALLTGARARRDGIVVAIDGGDIVAPAPRELLAQALLNLLLNALAHSPPGGRVELVARRQPDAVSIFVRDQGPGVPEAERDRIFEPFRSRGAGTGLGLAVVRRLARELGWRASVRDAAGGGAEFELRLPGPGAATAPRPAETAAAAP